MSITKTNKINLARAPFIKLMLTSEKIIDEEDEEE